MVMIFLNDMYIRKAKTTMVKIALEMACNACKTTPLTTLSISERIFFPKSDEFLSNKKQIII